MKLVILASGSKGNATIIDFDDFQIMIDMGLSYKCYNERMNRLNYKFDNLKMLLITHEHIDHSGGIKTFLSKNNTILGYSYGTKNELLRNKIILDKQKDVLLNCFDEIKVEDATIIPFYISHDAAEPMGFILEKNEKKIVYLTDSGYVSNDLIPLLRGADCYIFEANHDPELLLLSERPFYLKQRILGDKGHLSNQDSAVLLSKLITEKTKEVILAHLSLECNNPDICLDTFIKTFKHYEVDVTKFNLRFASQFDPIEVII